MGGDPYVYIAAVGAVGLLLAALLLVARPDPLRTAVALVTANLLAWLGGEVCVLLAPNVAQADLAIRATYGALLLLPWTVHRLTAQLDDPGARLHRVAAAATGAAAGIGVGLLAATDLVIAGARFEPPHFHRVGGPLFVPVMATMFTGLLAALAIAIRAMRRTTDRLRRIRFQYLLAGVAANAALGLVDLAVLQPLGFRAHRAFLFPLGTVLACGATIYAVAHTRLLDLPTAARRSIVAVGLLGVLLVPCLGLSLLAELALTGRIELWHSVVTAGLFVIAGFGFPRLRVVAEQSLEQLCFGARADERRLVRALGEEVTTVLSLATLAVVTRTALGRAFGDAEPRLWLWQDERLGRLDPAGDAPPTDPHLLALLADASGPVLRAERSARDAGLLEAAHIELAVPLRVKGRLVGLLALGPRGDGRVYTDDDLGLVATVSSQVAIALENARLYEELRESRAEVGRASRLSALGMLAAGIAHEIRNPLVAVKTFLDLLPHRLNDPEFLGTFRDLSLCELRRVTDLISDLLTLGKSPRAERCAVALDVTLEPVLRLMESTARKSGVEVTLAAERNLPPVWGDPDQLKQIVLNLLLNAIEASPRGAGVTLSLSAARDVVELAVADQGPGIPPERLDAIFQPFFTTKESGTGLGLPLVHQMVVEHDGDIAVDSTPGRGTVFRVRLPAATPLRATGT
ncbi:MAG: GAF domain-containing protein [bacterium]|nr:GAF domain-containing protein [bacterium]